MPDRFRTHGGGHAVITCSTMRGGGTHFFARLLLADGRLLGWKNHRISSESFFCCFATLFVTHLSMAIGLSVHLSMRTSALVVTILLPQVRSLSETLRAAPTLAIRLGTCSRRALHFRGKVVLITNMVRQNNGGH